MKIIGIGAAGNKIALEVLTSGVVQDKDVVLINSTEKDIPSNMKSRAIILGNQIGGCGKERSVGKELILDFLHKKSDQTINWFEDDGDNHAVVIASTSGGTGSGVANILAFFLRDQLDFDVTVIGVTGFNEDVREIQNTIEFMQEIKDEFVVQFINNASFMKAAKNNKFKAEKLANEEIVKRIIILSGQKLKPSEQNIDEADRYKSVTYPGYQTVEYTELNDIKNSDDMELAIKNMIDNSASFITEPSSRVLAVMLNVKKSTLDYFDFTYEQLKEKYGFSYETFLHNQEPNTGENEWLAVVVSGMKLPIEHAEALYNEYKEKTARVDKSNDSFFDKLGQMQGLGEDSMFNRGARRRRNSGQKLNMESFESNFKKSTTTASTAANSSGGGFSNIQRSADKF